MNDIFASIIIPCLNEEETIPLCIDKAKEFFAKAQIKGEIIVVDNGSTDHSPEIARRLGATVITQPLKGYGAAYLKGIEVAGGEYIIMGDGDDTYDFRETGALIEGLREGYDLVIGSRFKGRILKGAMSFSHRYLGNPLLTTVLNVFFKARISDAHSGFRAITKDALRNLQLKTTGMEFASEMIVAALRERLRIKEVPITYYPRKGKSKLAPLSDAWRHFRFMLLFSPDWLFMIPGAALFLGGCAALFLTGWGKLAVLGHKFDIHAMIFFTFASLLGFQIISLGLFAKTYSLLEGFVKKDTLLQKAWRCFKLEKGLLVGGIAFLCGFFPSASLFWRWVATGFGPLNEARLGLVGVYLMILGIQIVFSSFFLSLLGIPKQRKI